METNTNFYIIPGLGNSGAYHWQTHFEKSGNNFRRIQQQEWDAPVCSDWIATIDKALADVDLATIVLIGHSLGCTTIAHWAMQYNKKIKGALLAAPSDVEAQDYTFRATGFSPIPLLVIPFKTIVVASEDDPWVTLTRAKFFADSWGSNFINIGKAGHINTAAGYTQWPQGMEILKKLV